MNEFQIFKLPVTWRHFDLDLYGTSELRAVINGLGLCIKYNNSKHKNDEEVKKASIEASLTTLIGISHHNNIYIEATSVNDALEIFYTQWHGASFFGFNDTKNALWISPEDAVVELPFCNLMDTNLVTNRFICSESEEDKNSIIDSYSGCIIDGYDPPKNCPLFSYNPKQAPINIIHRGITLKFNPLEI